MVEDGSMMWEGMRHISSGLCALEGCLGFILSVQKSHWEISLREKSVNHFIFASSDRLVGAAGCMVQGLLPGKTHCLTGWSGPCGRDHELSPEPPGGGVGDGLRRLSLGPGPPDKDRNTVWHSLWSITDPQVPS